MFSVTCVCYLLLSGELRNLVGSILGGQTGSNISLEQVRMVGEREGKERRGEGREREEGRGKGRRGEGRGGRCSGMRGD